VKNTFRGGVHPAGHKELSRESRLRLFDPKGEMVFPLSMHIGKPAKPVVRKNDEVKVGQLLAEADGFISAPIHSSCSGKVKGIEKRRVLGGGMADCIVIENDGQYTLAEGIGTKVSPESVSDDDILAACLAHDMVEDSDMKPEDLPVNGRVREAVALVSKNLYKHTDGWEETYFGDIRKNPLACLIKCVDRVNNLNGMADAFSREKMARYTAETDQYYPDLLEAVKAVPEWKNAWWLLRYQMMTMTEAFKRLL
jgi:hypothetical protein